MNRSADVNRGSAARFLITMAAVVVVVAGMKSSQAILVPFLLSVFIAIISAPLLFWLKRKGIPTGLALLLVIGGVLGIGVMLGTLVGTSINDFSRSLPLYQEHLQEKTVALAAFLAKYGVELSDQALIEYVDPGAAMKMASKMLTGLGNVLSNAFLILLTVIFILLEAASFPGKLHAAFGSAETVKNFDSFISNVNQYMVIKTWVSLGTGALVAVWLAVLGVDYPILWGVLAFLFNYVPNIGSIIAAVPAVLLALIQLGTTQALLAGAGYIVFNVVIGNVIEPRFMGRGLGLSTLVVFLSLIFWGWILGPVGMLLSIPLTMTLKIALSSNEETRWIGTLLGSDSPQEAD
jgi:predicted PurR-regulated permease PerM